MTVFKEKHGSRLLWALVAALSVTPAIGYAQTASTYEIATVGGGVLLRMARKMELPQIPPSATKNHVTGVIVAELETSISGDVARVTVFEAPSADVAASTQVALSQWRFEPAYVGGERVRVRGKVVFYLIDDHGTIKLRDSRDHFYLGNSQPITQMLTTKRKGGQ